MKKILISVVLFSFAIITGCLKFGEDVETVTPTNTQISRCKSEMCLSPFIKISPFGFKLEGSGIDDTIWFKFETNVANIFQIFDTKIIDTNKFKKGFSFSKVSKEPKWWDIAEKDLFGGQLELPNARFMDVGIEKRNNDCMVYIKWYET